MGFVALYDTSVLFPAPVCDLLIRIGQAGLVEAKWSEAILAELVDVLQKNADMPIERAERRCALMRESIRDVNVVGWEHLVNDLNLPDPEDNHVLAAAIRGHAQVIVTANLKHFPQLILKEFDIQAIHPDEFVVSLMDLHEGRIVGIVHLQAAALKNPPMSVPDVVDALARSGLPRTAARLRIALG